MTSANPRTFRSRFERFLEAVVLSLMTTLAVVVVLAVAFRKAGAAFVWYDEVASILLAWLTYYGASLAALKRAHIGFAKLIETAEPWLRSKLLVIREALVIGFFLLTAWAGWLVILVLEGTSLISVPWIPTQLTQSVIPIGAALFIIAELLSLPEAMKDPLSSDEGQDRPPAARGRGAAPGGPETERP